MSKQIVINLPVANLPKSMAFFKALGYSHNPQGTGDTTACIVISEAISVMLMTMHAVSAIYSQGHLRYDQGGRGTVRPQLRELPGGR